MIEPRSSFVDADDIRLHYLEWDPEHIRIAQKTHPSQHGEQEDSDNVPIVLLHGLGATADTWRLVAQHMYSKHLTLAFDLRGHGESDQPDSGYDLVTIAEDTIRGMAKLGLGQVALVGHGWGARVALVLAARHPALISHLILVDCPHVEPRLWPGMTRERFIRSEKSSQESYVSREAYLHALRSEMEAFWSPEIESIVLTYVRELPDGCIVERLHPEHQRQIREALWEDRALSYYGKLTCPVLLVPAAEQPQPDGEPPDRLESADEFAAAKGYVAQQVARAIQRCTVLWMPDTAHDIQLQRPEILASAITNFLQE
ncbi:MAG TPA: alpha/beta hydrolase [Ktedonobacteraceae bacterium]|nr:alpha/beta hydrolase [Ktedonobacteraceae bacterium]